MDDGAHEVHKRLPKAALFVLAQIVLLDKVSLVIEDWNVVLLALSQLDLTAGHEQKQVARQQKEEVDNDRRKGGLLVFEKR